jgi:hypothetical protein
MGSLVASPLPWGSPVARPLPGRVLDREANTSSVGTVISRARGLQGLRQRRSHSARRSCAARHVQAMLVPDTCHAFLHDRTTRVFCNFVDHPESSSDTSVNFSYGFALCASSPIPCTGQHNRQGRPVQTLRVRGSALLFAAITNLQFCGATSPGSEEQASWLRAVVMGNVRHTLWQRASHVMATCFTASAA